MRQVELVGGVIGQGDAGSGGLGVVHQRVDAAELRRWPGRSTLCTTAWLSAPAFTSAWHGQHLDAELGLKLSPWPASSFFTLRPVMTRFAPSLA